MTKKNDIYSGLGSEGMFYSLDDYEDITADSPNEDNTRDDKKDDQEDEKNKTEIESNKEEQEKNTNVEGDLEKIDRPRKNTEDEASELKEIMKVVQRAEIIAECYEGMQNY